MYLIKSRGGMRVTRSSGLAVKVGNDFVRFAELPAGIPENGDGDYEVMRVEDGSAYPEPDLYVKPAPPVKAAKAAPVEGEAATEPRRRPRVRAG